MLGLQLSPDGFFLEAHPKLQPVDATTEGVFFAGLDSFSDLPFLRRLGRQKDVHLGVLAGGLCLADDLQNHLLILVVHNRPLGGGV